MKNLQLSFAFLSVLVLCSFSFTNTDTATFTKEGFRLAQLDYFIKIDGIPGEITSGSRKGWIAIESCQFNTTAKTATIMRKTMPVASPAIMELSAAGSTISKVTIYKETAPDSNRFLEIKMEDVVISNYSTGGGSSLQTDEFSLNYTKITFPPK